MISKYFFPLAIGLLFSAITNSNAAPTTQVTADSGSSTIRDSSNVLLSGGLSGDGDGAVIQIGYYTNATISNNFSGIWVALSGNGSANTGGVVLGSSPAEAFNKTSIGDTLPNSSGDGTFGFSLAFVQGNSGTGNNLPGSTSIPLSIRFYNKSTVSSSTQFNVVSNDTWLWQTPLDAPNITPTVELSLNDPNLEWLDGAASAFRTTILIPEPATTGLLFAGIAGLAIRRRRV